MEWFVNDWESIDVQSKIRIMVESDLEADSAAAELYYGYIVICLKVSFGFYKGIGRQQYC